MKKKNGIWIYLIMIIVTLIFINCCKKDNDSTPNVIDIDGNVYKTIIIGTQTWMAENLKTTRFNDGTPIPNLLYNSNWAWTINPAYCWYNGDSVQYKKEYGALYNFYAVNTGKLAPKGWHIPTHEEWSLLVTYLGGDTIASGKIKEVGTSHWVNPNVGANNSSGFTALPGGWRMNNYGLFEIGAFLDIGQFSCWWSSSSYDSTHSWCIGLGNNYNKGQDGAPLSTGYSIRCLKD